VQLVLRADGHVVGHLAFHALERGVTAGFDDLPGFGRKQWTRVEEADHLSVLVNTQEAHKMVDDVVD